MKRSLTALAMSFAVLMLALGGTSATTAKPGPSYDWAGGAGTSSLR